MDCYERWKSEPKVQIYFLAVKKRIADVLILFQILEYKCDLLPLCVRACMHAEYSHSKRTGTNAPNLNQFPRFLSKMGYVCVPRFGLWKS